MLLTITYSGRNTQDLGYLLHKNPYRAQEFPLPFGMAYVFYPKVCDEQTTAALLLDINPVDLVRGKPGASGNGLFEYVNDRPYAASSFLSTAISRVFSTVMSGRCDKRPELASTPLALTARVHSLPCRGGADLATRIFAPLGYTVSIKTSLLDEQFPEWGESEYIDMALEGSVTLSELLNHLYVLIPVFDRQKHYYVAEDEIEKLLRHGEGWLSAHPMRDEIVRRYFSKTKRFAYQAIDRLMEGVGECVDDETPETMTQQREPTLNALRLAAVRDAVLESGAASVLDLGCGEGRLTELLLEEKQIQRVTAVDVSLRVLEKAKRRMHFEQMESWKREKLNLIQAALTCKDDRFSGFDAACVVEVIEHLDPMRIPAFERVVFEFAAPGTVILTTPNREYNSHYECLQSGGLRHDDHRFEWSRAEFRQWAEHICTTFGYSVIFREIGEADADCGAPTQMGVFQKCG